MTAAEKIQIECPLCRHRSLVPHCDGNCNWWQCRHADCDALIDGDRGIGHCLDPNGVRDIRSKNVMRIRLHLRGGAWVERSE